LKMVQHTVILTIADQ